MSPREELEAVFAPYWGRVVDTTTQSEMVAAVDAWVRAKYIFDVVMKQDENGNIVADVGGYSRKAGT